MALNVNYVEEEESLQPVCFARAYLWTNDINAHKKNCE